MSKYILMHKNIEVAVLEFNLGDKLCSVKLSSNREHIPLGGSLNNMRFYEWWNDRAVPKTRKGINHALRELGFTSTNSMLINTLALSLDDCYWIRPIENRLTWEEVSLFRNNFIDIFGELTFDTSKHLDMRNKTIFKHASSQGELQKKWCIDEHNRRFLVKGNWGTSYQQSLNEVLATEIHKLQGFNEYTPYYLTAVTSENNSDALGCYSYNFCNENVEFISAWEVLQSTKIRTSQSYYDTFVSLCINKLGLDETYVRNFLGYQILTDFILSNTDRHMNNIGVLRNPDTLQFLGFAPIYDSGNSMFFRSIEIEEIGYIHKIETHSFLKRELDMLKYVNFRDIVDLRKLPSDDFLRKLYSLDIKERHIRIEPVINAYNQKIIALKRFQNGEDIWKRK